MLLGRMVIFNNKNSSTKNALRTNSKLNGRSQKLYS